jgi:tRNA threonylcarbamoyladenosine biosynthesis protein TsaB
VILLLRTDSDMAEVRLCNEKELLLDRWEAGRKLSGELLTHIKKALQKNDADWGSLEGVVVFEGPGSFTGLRIGATVANTIAYAQSIPIVGTGGEDWAERGLKRLADGENDMQVIPFYGAEPNITKPNASA